MLGIVAHPRTECMHEHQGEDLRRRRTRPKSLCLKAKKPKGAKADELDSIAVPREETRRAATAAPSDRHRLTGETRAI